MKRAIPPTASVMLCLLAAVAATLAGGAPPQPGASGISAGCQDCHVPTGVVADGVSLAIEGVPEVYMQGRVYNITVVLHRGTGPQPHHAVSHGFQLGVSGGDLKAAAGTVPISDREVGSRGAVSEDRWSVGWTAPRTYEQVGFFATAVVADGDGTEEGDYWTRSTAVSYAPLDVPPEEAAGPWPYTLAFLLLAMATALVVGHVILATHRRPPPRERD